MNSLARTLAAFLLLLLLSATLAADTDDSAELTAMLNTFLAGASVDDLLTGLLVAPSHSQTA